MNFLSTRSAWTGGARGASRNLPSLFLTLAWTLACLLGSASLAQAQDMDYSPETPAYAGSDMPGMSDSSSVTSPDAPADTVAGNTAEEAPRMQGRFLRGRPVTALSSSLVTLPVEVMGADGTIAEVWVQTAATAAPVTSLWMQVHGLSYEDKASVRVNAGPWISLNNHTCRIEEPGSRYGGIGGALTTLKLWLPLPPGLVREGQTRLQFRFNHTDGISIGFRVLQMQMRTAAGQPALDPGQFTQDDPAQWQAPLPRAADIAQGKRLWTSATLRETNMVGAGNILATCSSCHTDDGRDLKYFNYSNYSIVERSKFHGMTEMQGEQIASYIRTLKNGNGTEMVAPGRPWNPPYQPGPGLDSKPVSAWAAGAGIDAVLAKDSDMLPALFPGYVPGDNSAANLAKISKSAIATTKTINLRETPIAIPLLDWNHWLPRIAPVDAWGDAFTKSLLNVRYEGETGYRSYTVKGSAQNFASNGSTFVQTAFGQWQNDRQHFLVPRTPRDNTAAGVFTREYGEKIYSVAQWQNVKTWGMMQEYALDDKGKSFFQTTKNGIAPPDRTWPAQGLFYSSPNLMNIPRNGVFRSDVVYDHESVGWYWLAAITNPGNRQRQGNAPIDYGYFTGRVQTLGVTSGVPNTMLMYAQTVLGGQQGDNGKGVDANFGWSPNNMMQVEGFVHGAGDPLPSLSYGPNGAALPGGKVLKPFGQTWAISPVKTQVATALLGAWFDGMKKFAPAQYYAGGYTSASEDPAKYGNTQSFKLYNTIIPNYRLLGVNNTLLNAICDWAKTVWPKGNWASLKR